MDIIQIKQHYAHIHYKAYAINNITSTTKQPSRQIIKWLFTHLAPYKTIVALALIALLFSSLAWLILGQGIRYVIDVGFVEQNSQALTHALYLVIAVVLLGAVATYFRFYYMVWLGERVCADIRSQLFSHLLTLSPSFYENTRTGEIISRFTSDTTLLQTVVGSGVSMALRSLVMFCGALILMGISSIKLTVLVFIAVPLILVPIKIFGNKVRMHSKFSQDKVAQVGSMVDESLHEIHTVQAFNHQDISASLFSDKVEAVIEQAKKRIHYRALLISIVMLISLSAIFIVTYIGANMVIAQQISVGELTAFVFYAVLAGASVATISEVVGELQKAAGASERIIELMHQTSDIQDQGTLILNKGVLHDNLKNQTTNTTTNPVETMRFDKVSFAYPSAPNKKVLHELSFTVKQGQTIAFVGPSGAGKSTIFQLIQRFYETNEGNITVLGHQIQHIQVNSLRAQFALVPQEAVIFAGSVAQNIAYANPNASQADIETAAKMAFADEFIVNLEHGYESELGERGVKLSGGQKQRIAIARAIASQRPILLLDEATSALDAASERFVKQAIDTLMSQKTTLIIAHRLSTVVNADLIIVLDKGAIVASGNHASLYEHSSIYKEFVDLQLIE